MLVIVIDEEQLDKCGVYLLWYMDNYDAMFTRSESSTSVKMKDTPNNASNIRLIQTDFDDLIRFINKLQEHTLL